MPVRSCLAVAGLALLTASVAPKSPSTRGGSRQARGRPPQWPRGPSLAAEKQILFGDLHVHTTFSPDAFLYGLPIFGGEGAHPPADACDFARWCAGLDFFSINDHAEGLTPALWAETQRSIRECDARATSTRARPTSSPSSAGSGRRRGRRRRRTTGIATSCSRGWRPRRCRRGRSPRASPSARTARPASCSMSPPPWRTPSAPAPYAEMVDRFGQIAAVPACAEGARVRELPPDCLESTATPGELFAKLDDWGVSSLVIPHGLAWGIHAPPGGGPPHPAPPRAARPGARAPDRGDVGPRQRRGVPRRETDVGAPESCPAPTPGFLPCCWRAGELMRERCGALAPSECDARVAEARRLAFEAGAQAHRVIPDTRARGLARLRSVPRLLQAGVVPAAAPHRAVRRGARQRRRNGRGRPPAPLPLGLHRFDRHAHGARRQRLQAGGPRGDDRPAAARRALRTRERIERWVLRPPDEPAPVAYEPSRLLELFDGERTASFLYPGGIVAVHADGTRPRFDLGRARAARGLRHERPAHACSGSIS